MTKATNKLWKFRKNLEANKCQVHHHKKLIFFSQRTTTTKKEKISNAPKRRVPLT
jgi:hypothetical protein